MTRINEILKSKKINNLLDFNTIKLSVLDNTDAKMISIEGTSNFTLIIYERNNNFLFQKITEEKGKGLTRFSSLTKKQ